MIDEGEEIREKIRREKLLSEASDLLTSASAGLSCMQGQDEGWDSQFAVVFPKMIDLITRIDEELK